MVGIVMNLVPVVAVAGRDSGEFLEVINSRIVYAPVKLLGKWVVYLSELSAYASTYHLPLENHQALTLWVPHTTVSLHYIHCY